MWVGTCPPQARNSGRVSPAMGLYPDSESLRISRPGQLAVLAHVIEIFRALDTYLQSNLESGYGVLETMIETMTIFFLKKKKKKQQQYHDA